MGIDMKVSSALLALSLALCCFAVDETFEECEGSVDSGLDFVAGTYFTTNVAGSYSYSLDLCENTFSQGVAATNEEFSLGTFNSYSAGTFTFTGGDSGRQAVVSVECDASVDENRLLLVSENPSLTYNFVLQYNDNNACGGDFSTVPETPSPTGPTAPPTGPTSPTSPTSPPACAYTYEILTDFEVRLFDGRRGGIDFVGIIRVNPTPSEAYLELQLTDGSVYLRTDEPTNAGRVNFAAGGRDTSVSPDDFVGAGNGSVDAVLFFDQGECRQTISIPVDASRCGDCTLNED